MGTEQIEPIIGTTRGPNPVSDAFVFTDEAGGDVTEAGSGHQVQLSRLEA